MEPVHAELLASALAEVERVLGPLLQRLASAVRRLEEVAAPQPPGVRLAPPAASRPAATPATARTLPDLPPLTALLPQGTLSTPLQPLRRFKAADLECLESELLQTALQSVGPANGAPPYADDSYPPPPADDEDLHDSPASDDPVPIDPLLGDGDSDDSDNDDNDDTGSVTALPHSVPDGEAVAPRRRGEDLVVKVASHRSSRCNPHIAELHAQLAQEALAGSFRARPSPPTPRALRILTAAASSEACAATPAPGPLVSALVRARAARALQAAAEHGTVAALRVAGALPWWDERRPLASYAYQGAVGLGLVASAALRARDLRKHSLEATSVPVVQDIVLPAGAAVAVAYCAAQRSAGSLADLLATLRAHAQTRSYEHHAQALVSRDAWLTALLGALACAGHTLVPDPPPAALAATVAATLLLTALGAAQLAVCNHLNCMVNHFCCRFMEDTSFDEAVREWNVVQAFLRVACRVSEGTFVALQATALAMVIVVGMDFSARGLHAQLPWGGLVLMLIVARLLAAATSVTSKCQRVPSFVNSLRPDLALDQSRLYLVHYVAYSQAGFCTYGVRLHSALALRLFYVICALAFGVATKLLSHG